MVLVILLSVYLRKIFRRHDDRDQEEEEKDVDSDSLLAETV